MRSSEKGAVPMRKIARKNRTNTSTGGACAPGRNAGLPWVWFRQARPFAARAAATELREKVTKDRFSILVSLDCAHVILESAGKNIRKLVPQPVGGYDAVIANFTTPSD